MRPSDTSAAPAVPTDPGDRLLTGLEELVRRHRALANDTTVPLHTELITAEVALHLAVARSAGRYRRRPAGQEG